MSEVKRYDISCFGGMSMDECGDGAYVNYEDYAALEAKCAALAAENARMKSGAMDEIKVINRGGQAYCVKDGVQVNPIYARGWNDYRAKSMQSDTTATDAFLAEVRAQGVDSAINRVIAMMNHQHPVTSKAIDIMRVHAYQLRKGGEQK